MPPLEDADLMESAVVWDKVSVDGYNNPIVSEPREVEARWKKGKREVGDLQSGSIQRDATVALSCSVKEGSIIWEGTLDEWEEEYALGTGTHDPGLYVIQGSSNVKDIKGITQRYEYNINRWMQELPTVIES